MYINWYPKDIYNNVALKLYESLAQQARAEQLEVALRINEKCAIIEGESPAYPIPEENLANFINGKCSNENENDRSLKNNVDVLIIPLVNRISLDHRFKTTSSCSGRIVLFEIADKNTTKKLAKDFGRGGRFIASSHCHVNPKKFLKNLENVIRDKHDVYKQTQKVGATPQLVHAKHDIEHVVILKYEPLLVHVECNSMKSASILLDICKSAGLKQCGISSTKEPSILVAIRSTLCFECPVAIRCYDAAYNLLSVRKLMSDEALEYMVDTCNAKQSLNFETIVSLHATIDGALSPREAHLEFRLSDNIVTKLPNIRFESKEFYGLQRVKHVFAATSKWAVVFGGFARAESDYLFALDLSKDELSYKKWRLEDVPLALISGACLPLQDPNVFCYFGGRKGAAYISNETWILVVDPEVGPRFIKCAIVSDSVAAPRFRHAVIDLQRGDGFLKFILVGGATALNPLESSLLNDIWEAKVIWDATSEEAQVHWRCLLEHDVNSPGWCTGCLALNSRGNIIYKIGGFDGSYNVYSGDLNVIEAIDLENASVCRVETKTSVSRVLYSLDGTAKSINIYPLNRWGHATVRISKDAYLVVGGSADGIVSNDIWYLYLPTLTWYMLGRVRDGSAWVQLCASIIDSAKYGKQLWIAGGATSIAILGFMYNPMSIVNLEGGSALQAQYCCNALKKQAAWWMVTCNRDIKRAKNIAESLKVYDKSRKIIMLPKNDGDEQVSTLCNDDHFIVEYILNSKGVALIPTRTCVEHLDDEYAKDFLDFQQRATSFGNTIATRWSCVLTPDAIKLLVAHDSSSSSCSSASDAPSKVAMETDSTSKQKKNMVNLLKKALCLCMQQHDDLAAILDECNAPTNKYDLIGTVLILPKEWLNAKVEEKHWNYVRNILNVTSICCRTGGIKGECRIPQIKLFYGDGETIHHENGVAYSFNVAKSMFSRGNVNERIRLVKDYFQGAAGRRDDRKGVVGQKDLQFNESLSVDKGSNAVRIQGQPFTHPRIQGGALDTFRESGLPFTPSGVESNALNGTNAQTTTGSPSKPEHTPPVAPPTPFQVETVIDLFCGIGYFSIPLLKYTSCKIVACDINPESIYRFNENLKLNNIDSARVVAYIGNAARFGLDFAQEHVGTGNRILLGLLPDSTIAYESAIRAMDLKRVGYFHVHGVAPLKPMMHAPHSVVTGDDFKSSNTKTNDVILDISHDFAVQVLEIFHQLWPKGHRHELCIAKSTRVKRYKPHTWHFVIDLKARPI